MHTDSLNKDEAAGVAARYAQQSAQNMTEAQLAQRLAAYSTAVSSSLPFTCTYLLITHQAESKEASTASEILSKHAADMQDLEATKSQNARLQRELSKSQKQLQELELRHDTMLSKLRHHLEAAQAGKDILQAHAGQIDLELKEAKQALASMQAMLNMDSTISPADIKIRILNSFDDLTAEAGRLVELLPPTVLDAASFFEQDPPPCTNLKALHGVFRNNDRDISRYLEIAVAQIYMNAAMTEIWKPFFPGALKGYAIYLS